MSRTVRSLSLAAVVALSSGPLAAQESGHDLALGPDPIAGSGSLTLHRLDGAPAPLPGSPDGEPLAGRLHWGTAAAAADKRADPTLERLLDLDNSESDMASNGGFADIDLGGIGGVLLGFVQNRWTEQHGMAAARETVLSGGADLQFHLGGTPVSIASELAFYNADRGGEAQDMDVAASNLGYALKLESPRGAGAAGYGLLFEYYGEGFRPHGRKVDPDQMRLRLDGSWLTVGGIVLSGYAGRAVTGLDADAPTEKWRGGLSLGRKLDLSFLSGLDLSVGLDVERHSKADEGAASLRRGVRFGLTAPLTAGFRGRIKLHAKQFDEASDDADKTETGIDAGFDRGVRLFGFDGHASAGFVVRSTAGEEGPVLEQGARVEATLGRGVDRLDLRGSLLSRSAEDHRLGRKLAVRWSRHVGGYSIGLEAEHRHGVGDDDEAAYLAGLFVTGAF
ncbi:MAG: hypothetical protein MI806_06090 [Minwuiales bacterium]|nr:hypothetical protein [Minwuiales bacterium]